MEEPAMMPTVTVIVPTYNDTVRLQRCLELLQAQDYPADRFDVIVVDNASTEDLRPALPADPRFRIIREDRPGSYVARNAGVAVAGGELLAFTDSDCLPRPSWLSAAVAVLTDEPAPDAVGGAINMVFEGGAGPRTTPEYMDAMEGLPQEHSIAKYPFAMTANLVVRASTFHEVGPFDASLKSGGDLNWGLRLAARGGRFAYSAEAQVDHPSRPTWGGLTRKSWRVAGGVADLESAAPVQVVARSIGGELWDALAFWKVVWRFEQAPPTPAGKVRLAVGFSYVRGLRSLVRAGRLFSRTRSERLHPRASS